MDLMGVASNQPVPVRSQQVHVELLTAADAVVGSQTVATDRVRERHGHGQPGGDEGARGRFRSETPLRRFSRDSENPTGRRVHTPCHVMTGTRSPKPAWSCRCARKSLLVLTAAVAATAWRLMPGEAVAEPMVTQTQEWVSLDGGRGLPLAALRDVLATAR